ncbi:hypothetical protein JAAARDRAFT_187487 [Jaapia argillacea MUCL 33604]|uniref:non-specific serine/threonine protein kinase n=1 Tax=Jaapia argillacea MUCL 33604 TaxID=933084 RepID=A0A067QKR6_9AGAM|nr:hypothetical protein JAAARDRAFT_187487 [Jaapia argillacea MUCL 33604]
MSSDDPIGGYNVPEMEEYRSHLAQLFPGLSNTLLHDEQRRAQTSTREYVDLDEDMDEDEEDGGIVFGELNAVSDDDGLGDEDAEGEEDLELCGEEEGLEEEEEDEEETTLSRKPREEQEEIEEEIGDLEESMPTLTEDYKLLDRLGTGTFSSVYKAIDLHYHDKWDNAPWQGSHLPSSSAYYQSAVKPSKSKVYVAIKRIYVTSSPERIRNEIDILEDCRGCRHSSQLITAFRHEDQIVAIMPYHKNEDFRDFYRILPMAGIKAYFRCLFRALRDIHARGIIHRDVKPANFLFDPRTGIGTLCDFGLASRVEPGPTLGACLHTGATAQFPHGRVKRQAELDCDYIKKMQKEARQKSAWPSERVGYPEHDKRPVTKANRAGTRGFRAPEVLLKCGEQTGAIDIWSAGMILLFFLTGKFPLFASNDDIEALMEIAVVIGRRKMEKAATLHSRTFATNVPSITPDGTSWREFVERQNPKLLDPPQPNPKLFPYSCETHNPPSTSETPSKSSSRSHSRSSSPSSSITPHQPPRESSSTPTSSTHAEDVDGAFDLLEQLMQPESTKRLTARGALYHPFLAPPEGELQDDEFFPHPFGEGVCGQLHFMDEVTEEPCVRVFCGRGKVGEEDMTRMEVRRLVAGEGVAIGRMPCEFHKDECYGFGPEAV